MTLEQRHIHALAKAEKLIAHRDFFPYLELKALLPNGTADARNQFRSLFTQYYGLNVGGLTEAFKDRYFEILFGGNIILNGAPDYSGILSELSTIPRKNGTSAMPFSFVSKLVAIHRETSPIYDRHVLNFFGVKAPASSVAEGQRIQWYVSFLEEVRSDYENWSQDERLTPVLQNLIARDPRLAQCSTVRLIDLLVWKVGNQQLLQSHERSRNTRRVH